MSSPHPRRRLGWILAAGFICGLALVPSQVTAKQGAGVADEREVPSTFCRRGDALLALGRIAVAEAAFEEELETDKTVRCAREGLATIGHEHACAVAKALLKAGESAEANRAYRESLKAKPLKKCAAAGVKESAEDSKEDSRWGSGHDLEVGSKEGVIVSVSSSSKGSLSVNVSSSASSKEDSSSGFEGFSKGVFEFALELIKSLAFLAAPLALGGLILLNFQARFPRLRDRWPASSVRRPSVSIEPFGDGGFDPKIGIGATALLKERIEPGSGPQMLKIVSGDSSPEGSFIKAVGELSSQAKVWATIGEVLLAFLPRRRFKLSGELQPRAAKSGPGISVELDRRLVSKGGITLWAYEFPLDPGGDDVDAIRRLVTPAAAWISHVATQKGNGTPIMADKAMSWAKFKAGLEWQQEGDREKAEWLYRSAIAIDANNYGAQVNLALLVGGDGGFKDAVRRLESAIRTIEEPRSKSGDAEIDHTLNPDWYRARYSLASLYVNWAARGDDEEKVECLREAGERVERLLDQIEETLSRRPGRRSEGNAEPEAIEEFLACEVRPNATILAAEIRVAKESGAMLGGDLEEVEEALAPSTAELNYSAARFYAQAGNDDRGRACIEAVIEKTDRGEWQALAHRIVRDPVIARASLDRLRLLPDFVPMLEEAMASARATGLEWLS